MVGPFWIGFQFESNAIIDQVLSGNKVILFNSIIMITTWSPPGGISKALRFKKLLDS